MNEMQQNAKTLFGALLDLTLLVESVTAVNPKHLHRAEITQLQRRLAMAAGDAKTILTDRAASVGVSRRNLPWSTED